MKNLGKVKAIIISSIIALVMVVGMVLTFIPMNLGKKDYESFVGALSESTTISGGMSVEYTIAESGDDKQIKQSISLLREMIAEYGYKSVTVYLKGEDKIRVDLNEPVLVSEKSATQDFLTSLASGKLEFKNKDDASATLTPPEGKEVDPTLIVIDGSQHIEKISKINYSQASGIQIDFNSKGKEVYASTVNQPLFMFVGGKEWPSKENNEISPNTDSSATSMYLMFNSPEVVDAYYYTLKAGMMPIELDSENVSIVYNENRGATVAKVAGIVLTLVVVVALIVLAGIKQKGFAIASVVSSLIMLSLEMFLLQAMNWVVFGLGSMIAIVFVAVLTYVLNTIIYNAINAEMRIGKSIGTAVDDAYRKNMWLVIDTLVATFIVGFILAVSTTGELVGIGTMLSLSAVFLGVNVLLFNRLILNCLYSLSPEKMAGFLGFNKGGKN